jgi:hypothetical protein
MSHTDKDRPYWVKLNDDGNSTHHDHLHLGREVYRHRAVRDEHNRLIIDEVDNSVSAYEWRAGCNYRLRRIREDMDWEVRWNIDEKAKRLILAGNGDYPVIPLTRNVVRTEEVLSYTVADHCTEGEKLSGPGDAFWGPLPCVPEITNISWRALQTSGMSKQKRFYGRKYYSARRIEARDALIGAKNRYNSGDDLEDFNDVQLLRQTHHSMAWDLY